MSRKMTTNGKAPQLPKIRKPPKPPIQKKTKEDFDYTIDDEKWKEALSKDEVEITEEDRKKPFHAFINSWFHGMVRRGILKFKFPNGIVDVLVNRDCYKELMEMLIDRHELQILTKVRNEPGCFTLTNKPVKRSMTAREFMSEYLPEGSPCPDFSEKVDTKIEDMKDTVHWYFTKSKSENVATVIDHAGSVIDAKLAGTFNINNLKTILREIRSGIHASGILSSWIQYNLRGSSSPMYIGEAGLCSLYLHLGGAEILWLCIAQSEYQAVIDLIQKKFGKTMVLTKGCLGVAFHNISVIHPTELDNAGINYTLKIQRAGEMMVFPPWAFHSYIAMGPCAVETVNFSDKNAIPHLLLSKVDNCRHQRKPAEMFVWGAFQVLYRYRPGAFEAYAAGEYMLQHPLMKPDDDKMPAVYGPFPNVESLIEGFHLYRKRIDDRIVLALTVMSNFAVASTSQHDLFIPLSDDIINCLYHVNKNYLPRVVVSVATLFTSLVEQSWDKFYALKGGLTAYTVAIYLMDSFEHVYTFKDNNTCAIHYALVKFFVHFFSKPEFKEQFLNDQQFIESMLRAMHVTDTIYIDKWARGSVGSYYKDLKSTDPRIVSFAVWELLNRSHDTEFGMRDEFLRLVEFTPKFDELVSELSKSKIALDSGLMLTLYKLLSCRIQTFLAYKGKKTTLMTPQLKIFASILALKVPDYKPWEAGDDVAVYGATESVTSTDPEVRCELSQQPSNAESAPNEEISDIEPLERVPLPKKPEHGLVFDLVAALREINISMSMPSTSSSAIRPLELEETGEPGREFGVVSKRRKLNIETDKPGVVFHVEGGDQDNDGSYDDEAPGPSTSNQAIYQDIQGEPTKVSQRGIDKNERQEMTLIDGTWWYATKKEGYDWVNTVAMYYTKDHKYNCDICKIHDNRKASLSKHRNNYCRIPPSGAPKNLCRYCQTDIKRVKKMDGHLRVCKKKKEQEQEGNVTDGKTQKGNVQGKKIQKGKNVENKN